MIKSWTFLEMIAPGEIPSLTTEINSNLIKGDKRFKSVVPISQSDSLFKTLELRNPTKNTKQFTYYMNAYTKHELVVLLRNYFKSPEEIINKSNDLYYSFSFDVNDKDEYIEGSLFIPHVQLIIDDIIRAEYISYEDFVDRYDKRRIKFQEEIQVIFQNKVNEVGLKKAEKLFVHYFSSVTHDTSRLYVQCLIFNKTTTY